MATVMLDPAQARQRLAALYARYAQRIPQWVALLLLLLLARQAAELVWALVPTPRQAAWHPPSVAPAQRAQTAGDPVRVITQAALFGRYQAPAAPSVAALANAPETNLNLDLLGILANRARPQDSRAVIAGGSGGEKPYAIGDAIGDGVTLKAIFPDRVVLSRRGKLETLRLDKDRPAAGGDLNTPIAVAGGGAEASAEKLAQIRSELLANPAQAGNFIRVQPAQAPGGGQLGYRIYPGSDGSAFQAAGLRPGDLVTAVNGVPLNNPAQTLQLLSQLSSASQVTLTIQRGNQTQTVNLRFAQ